MELDNLNKPFFAEKVPEGGDSRIVVAAESLLTKIMCAPKTSTLEDVERAAGRSGTSSGWKADTERPDCCVQCQDDPDRQHWLLFC